MTKKSAQETISKFNKSEGVSKIICPQCGSTECYREEMIENMYGYICKGCGYTSNSVFTKNSDALKQAMATMPEMIKDLKFFDEERGIYWFLAAIQTHGAYAFPEPDEVDWHWTVAKIEEIPQNLVTDYPVEGKENTFYTHRLAIEKAKKFDKNSFTLVLKEVGLSQNEKEK